MDQNEKRFLQAIVTLFVLWLAMLAPLGYIEYYVLWLSPGSWEETYIDLFPLIFAAPFLIVIACAPLYVARRQMVAFVKGVLMVVWAGLSPIRIIWWLMCVLVLSETRVTQSTWTVAYKHRWSDNARSGPWYAAKAKLQASAPPHLAFLVPREPIWVSPPYGNW